jgi:hypothetical protein
LLLNFSCRLKYFFLDIQRCSEVLGPVYAAPWCSTDKMTDEERSRHSNCKDPNVIVFNSFSKKSILRKLKSIVKTTKENVK